MYVEKFISWLTLLSGISISAVAIFYSVSGLISIFSTAVLAITIMGIVLEIGKLMATVWLKRYWHIATTIMKSYLIVAIMILMLITSLGIFGFLSRAHLDQKLPTGDIADKIEIIDSKIQDNLSDIDSAKKSLLQLDSAVDETMNRTTDKHGALTSVKIRQSQKNERNALRTEIEIAKKRIVELKDNRNPLSQQLRKTEAEFGPITYIAALIYDDPNDKTNLEKAVRFVIILLVIVFDPLAVTLLLASQHSFRWINAELRATRAIVPTEMSYKSPEDLDNNKGATLVENEPKIEENDALNWAEIEPKIELSLVEHDIDDEEELSVVEDDIDDEPKSELSLESTENKYNEKKAKAIWKSENQSDTLKHQEKLHSLGLIDNLPWEN
jgi:hypothetical protein